MPDNAGPGSTLRRPRLLLVNDDGVGAVGLEILKTAAAVLSDDIHVIAPAAERSGAAHSLTLTGPLRVREIHDREFAVDGTPVDCVALALAELMKPLPDLVLSGVNRGPNLGDDILYSGTCGAAREAAMRGIPAVALSLAVTPGRDENWGGVEHHLPLLLDRLIRTGWPSGPGAKFLNINFPSAPPTAIAGVAVTRVGSYPGTRLHAVPGRDPRDVPYWWLQLRYPAGPFPPGTDIAAVDADFVSITPIRADITDESGMTQIDGLLSSAVV